MDIGITLHYLRPNSQWIMAGSDYESLEWLDPETTAPTYAELEQAWPQAEYANSLFEIEVQRLAAYRNDADPLFFKWQAGEATEQNWKEARAAVVEKYPYPEPPVK